jgi:hypothetical protein
MYTVEKLRELGFYVWTDGNMVHTKRWNRGPIDKVLVSNLLEEMKKNKADVVKYLQPLTKEKGPDGKPVFTFHMRNVSPPIPTTENQQYFIKKHETEFIKLLKDIFRSRKKALEELQKMKSSKQCASFYIELLKSKEKEGKRRIFNSNPPRL